MKVLQQLDLPNIKIVFHLSFFLHLDVFVALFCQIFFKFFHSQFNFF